MSIQKAVITKEEQRIATDGAEQEPCLELVTWGSPASITSRSLYVCGLQMSRRGGRGGGSAAAYQQRMMLQERPPPLRTLAPHLPDPSKGRLFTITTVPLKGKRLDTILR